jgi:hypothetical protein
MNKHGYRDSFIQGAETVDKIVDIVRMDWGFHDFQKNPNRINYKDKKQREQEYDSEIYGKHIECKGQDSRFTCPADFPHKKPFVNTVYSWDILIVKPVLVLLYSLQTGRILGIDTIATRAFWDISKPWWDWRMGKLDISYTLPSKYWLLTEAEIREKLQSITPWTAPAVR